MNLFVKNVLKVRWMSSKKSCKICYKLLHPDYMEKDGWEYVCTKCVLKHNREGTDEWWFYDSENV